jgi:hypothetical protein
MSIMPLVMKGYGVISAVDVFEFKEGGCTEAETYVGLTLFLTTINFSIYCRLSICPLGSGHCFVPLHCNMLLQS